MQRRLAAQRIRIALTLIELLVVIAIIGVLVAILLPAVNAARNAARKISCKNNLKQLGLGLHSYQAAYERLPCSSLNPEWITSSGEWGWGASLLPFIEQNALYDRCDFSLWPAEEPNWQAIETIVPTFRCPSETSVGVQLCEAWDGYDWVNIKLPNDNYGLNGQLDVLSSGESACWRFADITDGLSSTIMLGETIPFAISEDFGSELYWHFTWSCSISAREGDSIERDFWTSVDCTKITKPVEQDWNYLSSYQPGGAHAALCDGSVQFISENIDQETLKRLANPKDGKPVGNF